MLRTLRHLPLLLLALATPACQASTPVHAQSGEAPTSPASEFVPARYLGRWFEAARLPTPIQPGDTLATAEYAATEESGIITVRNTAYARGGEVLSSIEGRARLMPGDPPGRFAVSFGPVLPEVSNYHVLYVDSEYRHAVVGAPDRGALWILVREVPVSADKLRELTAIATEAGYDTSSLVIADWK